jgi:hypothetical protein
MTLLPLVAAAVATTFPCLYLTFSHPTKETR